MSRELENKTISKILDPRKKEIGKIRLTKGQCFPVWGEGTEVLNRGERDERDFILLLTNLQLTSLSSPALCCLILGKPYYFSGLFPC